MKKLLLTSVLLLSAGLAMAASISGTVYSETGEPLQGRKMVLTHAATGQPAGTAVTDVDGHFQFPNLDFGDYMLCGDVANKINPKLNVPVTSTRPNMTDIIFKESDRIIRPGAGVGVEPHPELKLISVYPVPAVNTVTVQALNAVRGAKTIVLRDRMGREINRQLVNHSIATIPVDALPAGLYNLQVCTELGNVTFSVLK